MKKTVVILSLIMGGLLSLQLNAASFQVTVNSTPLNGLSGFLAFDFLAGSPVPGNSAGIVGFATAGTLGSSTPSGDVTGSLIPGPLTLGDTQFFNEWLQTVTMFGNSLSFVLNLGSSVAPGALTPDAFSFFLLDSNQVPFATSDPTGAGALFFINLDGANTNPTVYSSRFATATVQPISSAVPEPSAMLLILIAVPFVLLRKKKIS